MITELMRNIVSFKYTIPKERARILWRYDKDDEGTKIADLVVAEFFPNEDHRSDENPKHLYTIFNNDIGNCNLNWELYSLGTIALIIFGESEFVNRQAKEKAINELLKIKEFRDEFEKLYGKFF